jgi:hypothetical protein
MTALFCAAAAAGLFFFLKNRIYNYLFFRVPFALLDYEKPPVIVFIENILMLLLFAFAGLMLARLCKKGKKAKSDITKQ